MFFLNVCALSYKRVFPKSTLQISYWHFKTYLTVSVYTNLLQTYYLLKPPTKLRHNSGVKENNNSDAQNLGHGYVSCYFYAAEELRKIYFGSKFFSLYAFLFLVFWKMNHEHILQLRSEYNVSSVSASFIFDYILAYWKASWRSSTDHKTRMR